MWFWKLENPRQFGSKMLEWVYCAPYDRSDSADWLLARGYVLVCPD